MKLKTFLVTLTILSCLFVSKTTQADEENEILFYNAIISKEGEIIATIPITKENIYHTENNKHYFQIFIANELLEPLKEVRK